MRHLKRFTRDESGVTSVTFGLALVAAIGAGGAAFDYGVAAADRTALQAQADAAALAAAREIGRGDPETLARNHLSGAVERTAGLTVTAKADDERVTVTATRRSRTAMMGVVGIKEITVAATATAIRPAKGPPICILALSRTAAPGVSFSGNAKFKAEGCAVQSNSTAVGSMNRKGSADASADAFCASGTVTGGLSPAKDDCIERSDPFARIAPPTPATPCRTHDRTTTAFTPGTYCDTIEVRTAATFAPGVYVLLNGLKINANASATGTGLTFYLTGADATFDINGGGNVNLQAQLSGSYQGILFWQDREVSAGAVNKINGNSTMTLVGAIYAPTQQVEFQGNSSYGHNSRFMPVIADTVSFTGSTEVTVRADTTVMDTMPSLPHLDEGARLVH